MQKAISSGKFREDLFYRLSTVPIQLPALRKRKEDIHLIFRKFAHDFAEKYRMPAIKLTESAVEILQDYPWPGNIRQLKNLVEQLSVIETEREIDDFILSGYMPIITEKMPSVIGEEKDSFSERELMYKFLFDMKKDLTELKKLVLDVIAQGGNSPLSTEQNTVINRLYQEVNETIDSPSRLLPVAKDKDAEFAYDKSTDSYEQHEEVEESLSLEDREKELIQKALEKHRGKRKYAAGELGISERTLYRKIKEYNLIDL